MELVSQLFPTVNGSELMRVGYSYKVVFREHVNKRGLKPLYLRVTVNRKKRDLPLGLQADPLFFNEATAQLERTEANSKDWKFSENEVCDFNLMVKNEISKATNIMVEYRLSRKDPDLNDFIRQFTDYEKRDSFIKFFQNNLNARKDISGHTRELHQNTIKLLKEFQEEIRFMDLKLEFINTWDRWLRVEKKHNHNTRGREHRDFLQYVNRAIASGVRVSNPYEGFKWPPITRSIEFLEQDELQKWTEHYFSKNIKATHKRSLKYFLGMCYTSVRISDVRRFKDLAVIDNKLIFVPVKTTNTKGQPVIIPLNDMAKKLIEEIKASPEDMVSDNTIRNDIKEIAKILGCKKNIKPKDARHTFGTVFCERGGSVEVLQDILGHSDIEETMVYVHITNERKKQQMANAFNGFHQSNTGLWDHLKLKPERKKGSGRKSIK
jgi:integrase/recombinase XerD